MTDRTFTLPELASLVDIEYRTLHTWVGRGLLAASCQEAQGSGTRNLFDRSDALEASVLADLRRAGVELAKLEEVAAERAVRVADVLDEGRSPPPTTTESLARRSRPASSSRS